MRGILLVALGAALIFLGVWHGDSSSGPGSVDAAERTLPYDGAPSTLEQQTPEGATARAQGVVEGLGPARPVEDDSSALGPAVTPRAEPVPDPQPGGAPAAPPAPPRNDLELVSLDRGGPQGPAAADEPRNVPPEELARLLVQCWTLE
ncbi:MAG: hypothetical protein R3F49_22025, partial [Planctomycetota bacterium]